MKSSLCTLGAAALLSLAAFASTPAQGQTTNGDELVIAPKNSAVKVIDSSTENSLSITMVGTPKQASQKNTAGRADKVEKVDTSVLNQKAKVEPSTQRVKQNSKDASKVVEQKKKESTQTAR